MDHPDTTHQENEPSISANFGSVPNPAEAFGTMPNAAEAFGTVPHPAEGFRTVPTHSERKESHTLTVREVARMFETAGVARTERSIINWCQPNKMGIARLDYYFDPNERKYFISPQSVEAAIQEEKAKVLKGVGKIPGSESVPKPSETLENIDRKASQNDQGIIRELEMEMRDLQIANRVKDGIIERLEKDRELFQRERQHYIDELINSNRKLGELETKLLLQLKAPDGELDNESTT